MLFCFLRGSSSARTPGLPARRRALLSTEFKEMNEQLFGLRMSWLSTSAFTNKPESMKYRGLMELEKRGDGFLNYGAPMGRWSLRDDFNGGDVSIPELLRKNMTRLCAFWEEHPEEDTKNDWIPLTSILGNRNVPAAAARVIKQAVDKMISRGDITKKNAWQALEFWAADYLAGGE